MQPETNVLSNVLQSHYLTKDLQKYHASYCTNETLISLRVVEQVDVMVTIKMASTAGYCFLAPSSSRQTNVDKVHRNAGRAVA